MQRRILWIEEFEEKKILQTLTAIFSNWFLLFVHSRCIIMSAVCWGPVDVVVLMSLPHVAKGSLITQCRSVREMKDLFKGQVAWISEKHRLPVKTSTERLVFTVRNFIMWGFTTQRERNYVIYVHIDVNRDGWGWVCCFLTFNS